MTVTNVCRLCGTPLPKGARDDETFCCAGCAQVHQVLSNLDPTRHAVYLEAARKLGIIPAPTASPPAVTAPLPADPAAVRDERFELTGLVCPACAWVAEQVLVCAPGVTEARVDFFGSSALLRYDLRLTSADQLARHLAPLGYHLRPLADQSPRSADPVAAFTFVVSAVLFMNVMSLSTVRYAARLGWLDQAPPFLAWVELGLTLPVLALAWLPALRRALAALLRRRLTMDALIVVGAGAAFALSLAALLTGRDDIYFETSAGLLTISLLGRVVEARLRGRALSDLAVLLRLPVQKVRRRRDGRIGYAAIADVAIGDEIGCSTGELVPLDGVLIGAPVAVSEAFLSGEPRPVRKVAGDVVRAGSSVVEGELWLRATHGFADSRLRQIADGVSSALQRGESALRTADRIAAWFVPAVLLLAVAVWLARALWLGLDAALGADGLFPSIAVLAVACPCAFSLAGVTALTAATARLFKRGWLVREPQQLETLGQIDHLVFDKTGTLTEGELTVVQLCWRAEPEPALLGLVLAAEQGSTHPVASALRGFLVDQAVTPAALASAAADLAGSGRSVLTEHGRVVVGAGHLFRDRFEPAALTPEQTAVWFGVDGVATGCFVLRDRPRPDAAAALQQLATDGYRLSLLSGDRHSTTLAVAAELGLATAQGGLAIEDKVAWVEQRRAAGERVAFVGDGTNDALAMAAADAAIALARSTDEALAASSLVLLRGGLSAIAPLLQTCRTLRRVVRGNYVWAFAFNALLIPVAALGGLTPLAAMILMWLSSTAVLLNSLRLR